MSIQATDELRDFYHFIGTKINNGAAQLSPEEALDEWRQLHADPEATEEDIAAIKEALSDMANGDRGRPVANVLADIRSQFGAGTWSP